MLKSLHRNDSIFCLLKKTLVTDKMGKSILPSESNRTFVHAEVKPYDKPVKCANIENKVDQIKKENADLLMKLRCSYQTIDMLNKTNQEQMEIICDLKNQVKLARDETVSVSIAHNKMRTNLKMRKSRSLTNIS